MPLTAEELALLQSLTARAAAHSHASPAAKPGAAEGDVPTAEKTEAPKRRETPPPGISAYEQYHAATPQHASYFAGRQRSLPTKDNRAEAREKARLAVAARWEDYRARAKPAVRTSPHSRPVGTSPSQ